MKTNRDNFSFFAFIKERLVKASDKLISDMEKKLKDRKTHKKFDEEGQSN